MVSKKVTRSLNYRCWKVWCWNSRSVSRQLAILPVRQSSSHLNVGCVPVYSNGEFAPASLSRHPRCDVTYSVHILMLVGKVYSWIITSWRLLYVTDHFQYIELLMLLTTCFLLSPIATLWTPAFTPTQQVSCHFHSNSITMSYVKGDNGIQNAIHW